MNDAEKKKKVKKTPEEIAAYNRGYYLKNKERILVNRKSRQAADAIRNRERYANDPEYRKRRLAQKSKSNKSNIINNDANKKTPSSK